MTDIEGSTRMLRRLGEEYAPLLEWHHELVRGSAASFDGIEITNAGDGLAFLFPRVDGAVGAAVDVQHRLESTPVRVRAAVHLGAVVETRAGPVGIVLHECARLLAAATGGQVLVSPLVRNSLARSRGPVEVYELGRCCLRDVEEPWDLAEVVAAGRGPIGSLRVAAQVALPSIPNSFVGRSGDLERLIAACRSRRLLTLTGPGGIGKSRLAVETARAAATGRAAGAAMAELSAVREDAAVPAAVLRSIRPSADMRGEDQIAALISVLGASDLMLVLDNCEHVMRVAAELAGRLTQSCPSVVVLATSREPLGAPGEVVVPVPFLDERATAELFINRVSDVDAGAAADLSRSPMLAVVRGIESRQGSPSEAGRHSY